MVKWAVFWMLSEESLFLFFWLGRYLIMNKVVNGNFSDIDKV